MRNETISFVMSLSLYVQPSFLMEQLGFHWTEFYEICYVNIFRKSVDKIPVSLEFDKKNWYFT